MSPMRPLKPCAKPGCPELVPAGQTYCDKHTKAKAKQYDKDRGNFRQRGYSSRWDKARKWYLKHHSICEVCNEYPAVLVHHKLKVSERPDLLTDPNNLLACCRKCHSTIHKDDVWKRK